MKNKFKISTKEYFKNYYSKNKEKIAQKTKEYYKNNKEKIDQLRREYRQNNKEKINQLKREYRQNNKEKIAQQNREYRQNNKEKINQLKREYRQNNKDKLRTKAKIYYKSIKDEKGIAYYKILAHKKNYYLYHKNNINLKRRKKRKIYRGFISKNLTNTYLKSLIMRRSILKGQDIPITFLNAYREVIRCKRYAKLLTKNNNKNEKD